MNPAQTDSDTSTRKEREREKEIVNLLGLFGTHGAEPGPWRWAVRRPAVPFGSLQVALAAGCWRVLDLLLSVALFKRLKVELGKSRRGWFHSSLQVELGAQHTLLMWCWTCSGGAPVTWWRKKLLWSLWKRARRLSESAACLFPYLKCHPSSCVTPRGGRRWRGGQKVTAGWRTQALNLTNGFSAVRFAFKKKLVRI